MSEGTPKSQAQAVLLRAAPSVVRVEADGRAATGFVTSPDGHLITSLHTVAGARILHAVLPDGIRMEVVQVKALDERRDLAVLRLPVPELVPPLPLSAGMLPGEGDPVFVLRAQPGMAPEVRPLEVRAVQVLGDWLTLLELSRTIPEEASGGPVLDARGEVVGIATAALANGRSLGLVIPSRYAAPLLSNSGTRPLSSLEAPRRRAGRVRQVPQHPVGLLEGCLPDSVEAIATTLGQTINVGAPAYNRGDADGCYRLYARTAEQLIQDRSDCPGVQRALSDGLKRCQLLKESDERAWALRDTFDGLLDVISRWLESRVPAAPVPPRRPPPKTYLN